MASKKSKQIILVDPKDREILTIEKLIAHRYGMLHRAFSILIFRKRNGKLETLLQQRSRKKYHGGGLWSNACCSHPLPGEKMSDTVAMRLKEEMGIQTKLKKVGKFHYIAKMDHGMTENEIDHVFVGSYDRNDIRINPNEVENYRWMNIDKLRRDIKTFPKKYTPWLLPSLEIALQAIKIK